MDTRSGKFQRQYSKQSAWALRERAPLSALVLQFTPMVDVVPLPIAPDESLTVNRGQSVSVTPVITQGGSPVTPDSLTVLTQPSYGAASASGLVLNYVAAGNYSGADSFTYKATVAGVDSNTATVSVTIPQVPCCELGRVTKAYVSAYQRNRVHESNLFSQEKRCLTANFNGALAKGRSIASVVWSCLNPAVTNMQQAEVIDRETSVVILCQYPGISIIRCTATLDNAEQYPQMFRINVQSSPRFQGDPTYNTGPYTLTAVPA